MALQRMREGEKPAAVAASFGMMAQRTKPVHLVVDGLPAHKKAIVKEYVASTDGLLTLHFLPGYAPDLNPDNQLCVLFPSVHGHLADRRFVVAKYNSSRKTIDLVG